MVNPSLGSRSNQALPGSITDALSEGIETNWSEMQLKQVLAAGVLALWQCFSVMVMNWSSAKAFSLEIPSRVSMMYQIPVSGVVCCERLYMWPGVCF